MRCVDIPNPCRCGRRRPLTACALAVLLLAAAPAVVAQGRCVDEESLQAFTTPAAPPLLVDAQPRAQLQAMVREALGRSHAVGAAQLMAEAAQLDIDETRAAKAVQASVGGGVGPGGSRTVGVSENAALQLRATLNVSQLLYDGGRTDRLVDWRGQLAESARHGHLSQQEQLSLTAVALNLERSRFRNQLQVYRQHVRKMGCLVEALDTIVRADRGRASELVQAQKALEQAELAQAQTQSMVRQVEIRLRRLVGDGLPPTEGMATVFAGLPPLEELLDDVARAHDIAQLAAQAGAATRYADAVAAGSKPQLSWSVSGTAAAGAGGSQGSTQSGSYSVGLMVNIPLLAPGNAPASEAARKRAAAAALQRSEALDARRWRVAEVHEQSQSTLDRLRRLGDVLRNSDQVRNYTLQQWQQLGRRSLFDVMAAESEHYNLRISYVNALHDVQQLNANLLSMGRGVNEWLR